MIGEVETGITNLVKQVTADWAAAKESRFRRERDLPSGSTGADYHFLDETQYYRITEYSRSMVRDDAVIGPALKKATQNTIGEGFQFKPKTGNDKYDQAWWEAWDAYSNSPGEVDITGENDFHGITKLLFFQMLQDGDVWPLAVNSGAGKTSTIKIQQFESDQIRSPQEDALRSKNNIRLGVKMSKVNKREKAYVVNRSTAAEETFEAKNLKPIDIYRMIGGTEFRQFFHLYDPQRSSQTRGVTALAPAFDVAGMLEDINFAKMVQQLVVSCVGFIHTQAENTQGLPGSQKLTSDMLMDSDGKILSGFEPGFIKKILANEKLEGFSPKVPNAEYFEQVRLMLQLIGLNIGLPLVILLMDASETNFSGWRGAFDQAKEGFLENQRTVKMRWLVPFIRLWTAIQHRSGRLAFAKSVADPFRHEWGGRRWPYIQPLQDSATAILRQRNLLASPRTVHSEMAQDFETVVDETCSDNGYAVIKAAETADMVNKAAKLGDGKGKQPKVTWREILSLPTSDRVSTSYSFSESGDEPKPVKPPSKVDKGVPA